MDDAGVKETRRILRQVQTHLTQTSMFQGAAREQCGLVDVIYHPTRSLPTLNYVTPRRSTAWIGGKDVEIGLDSLRSRERQPRVEYIEGLFPPLFAKTLLDLGLVVEHETPLMVFQQGENKLPPITTPDGVTFNHVNDHESSAVWWYVWRNAYYDVITQTADPTLIGIDLQQIALGAQVNVVMYRYRFPIGAVRISLYKAEKSAQITTMAVMREWRTPELLRTLQAQAVKAALEHECALIFCAGETDDSRQLCRDNGFVDCGSVVCYAEKQGTQSASPNSDLTASAASTPSAPKDTSHVSVEQPLLTAQ